ncbi:MAG: glycosyltransferase family 2 protein, partial [Bacteroidetes bacterium]|nr:glycosyltransferase family 2 protein [Bacteroidota bacterium]
MPPYKLNALYNEWKKHGIGHVAAGSCEHFVDVGEVGAGFKRYDAWIQLIAKTNRFWEEIYLECTLQSNCWLMHRDDFEAAGGFEPEVYPEDYDLAFRLYKNGMQIHGIDQVTHLWRDHSARISRNWESYKDNRYFELKMKYFLELDFNPSRPLIIWGAGTNGKDLVKLFRIEGIDPIWVCDNRKKIGRNIYGITMQNTADIEMYINPQIIVAVSSPSDKREITKHLENLAADFDMNYWFWS